MVQREAPTPIEDFKRLIPDENAALTYFALLRRQKPFNCPRCHFTDHHELKDGVFRCEVCERPFAVKAGTIFENTKLPMEKCLLAILLVVKVPGLGSSSLSTHLSVTQSTAWKLLDRLRRASNAPSFAASTPGQDPKEIKKQLRPSDEDHPIGASLRRIWVPTNSRWWNSEEYLRPVVEAVRKLLVALPDLDPADVGACAAELGWTEEEVAKITYIACKEQKDARQAQAREEQAAKQMSLRRRHAPARTAFFGSATSSYEYRNGHHYTFGHKIG